LHLKWLLLNKGGNIRDMELASGLLQVQVDRTRQVLLLCGSESAADLAQRWFEANSMQLQRELSAAQLTWLRSNRALKLRELEESTGVICAQVPQAANEAKEGLVLVMMGSEEALQKAESWLQQRLPEKAAGTVVEVHIQPELLGLLVGKKGANLAAIKAQTGVHEIDLDDSGRVVILGPTAAAVSAAASMVKLDKDTFSASSMQLGWLLGNKGTNIRAMEESSQVVKVDVSKKASEGSKEGGEITLYGTAPSIIKAKLWMSIHMSERTVGASETCLTWLLSQRGAVIRDIEGQTGVDRVEVDGKGHQVIFLGTEEATASAELWLRDHSAEREVTLRNAQIRMLIANKAAKLRELEAASGVGFVEIDKEESTATLLGRSEAVWAALDWLKVSACVETVQLSSHQMAWLRGHKGAHLRGHIEKLQEASGLAHVDVVEEQQEVVLAGEKSALQKGIAWLDAKRTMALTVLPVEKQQLGWLIGKNGVHIKSLKQQSGIDSIQVSDTEDAVILSGSCDAVDSAALWIDCHISYFGELHTAENQIQVLTQELIKLPLIRGQPIVFPSARSRGLQNNQPKGGHNIAEASRNHTDQEGQSGGDVSVVN